MGTFTESTMSTAAGGLITVLDTYLVANDKWSIHDAAAGTNHKVYKQEDATNNSVFYLSVDDNYSGYAIVNLWEGWNDTTHVGTGNDAASALAYTTLYWKKSASFALSVNDLFMVYVDKTGYSYYVGQIEREDATKNMPLINGQFSSSGASLENPSAKLNIASSNGAGAGVLFDENGTANPIDYSPTLLRTSISGTGKKIERSGIYNTSTDLYMGTLYNVGSDNGAGVTGHGVNGDIFDNAGQDWLVVGNTGGSNYGCSVIKKD